MFKDSLGLTDLLQEPVNALGFDLWGVEFHSNSKNALLRVFIDKADGISVDDCAIVSHHIEGILDVEDPISIHYTLEVSSPGLDRIFFDFEQMKDYLEREMNVQLFTQVEGRRKFIGQLVSIGEENLSFVLVEKEQKKRKNSVSNTNTNPLIEVLKSNIDKISLVPQF